MRLIPADLIPARRRPFRWSRSGKETKGVTNLDRIEAGEGTLSALQMVREWQENKGATNLDRREAGEGTSAALQMVREGQENKGLEARAGKDARKMTAQTC